MNFTLTDTREPISVEECMQAIADAQEELKILAKRMKKNLIELCKTLPDKILRAVRKIAQEIGEAFTVDSLADYTAACQIYGTALADMLYRLNASFGGLKTAIAGAVAPIVALLVPVVQTAVDVLTALANSIGQVLRVLFFGSEEALQFSGSLSSAASAGTKLKKTLAGFDQINRLNGATASGTSGSGSVQAVTKPLSEGWQKAVNKILELIKPLQKIDLTPAIRSFERLKKALEPITKTLFAGLEWAWYNLLVPLAKWTVEELLPVFLDTLTAALEALGYVIEELKPAFTWLWENFMKPLASWAGDQVIRYFQDLTKELGGVSDWIGDNQGPVDLLIQSGKNLISTVAQLAAETMGWNGATGTASGTFSKLLGVFGAALDPLTGTTDAVSNLGTLLEKLAGCFGLVDSASGSTWKGLKQVWESAWAMLKEKTVDPAYSGIKSTINGIIAFINTLLRGATTAINFLAKSLNGLKFDVPKWVPLIGGKTFSFSMGTVTAPQIPYLAKGAVLPANQPFMAVLGDQKHGTNIEAPLATIQQAVAEVLSDQMSGMMAGFEALLAENRRLRATVEGIEVGDRTIGQAAARYQARLAIMEGGL